MIDVVIPARNEAETVAPIVTEFMSHPDICCVNVVIDADTNDGTAAMIPKHPNVHVRMPPLSGKGQLMAHGLDYVATERVLFCDADLTGLESYHIYPLTKPECIGMILGIPDYPDLEEVNNDVRVINSWPFVTGQRSMPASIARKPELHGYLADVQLNKAIGAAGLPVYMERLYGLTAPWRMTAKRRWEMERDRKWGKEKGIL